MKNIFGFPDYCITKTGQVWSKKHLKYLRQTKTNNGYLCVELFKNKKGYYKHVHRLVLETFIYKCPGGLQCRHIDNDKCNNHLSNLKWGTPKENGEDRAKTNVLKGERNGQNKLSKKDVLRIKELIPVLSLSIIGKLFGVTRQAVFHIKHGKNWAWLT